MFTTQESRLCDRCQGRGKYGWFAQKPCKKCYLTGYIKYRIHDDTCCDKCGVFCENFTACIRRLFVVPLNYISHYLGIGF